MGIFFRKSFRLGPLRLNLSQSGLGVSAGVKGAHIGVGPRGPYVSGGKGGIYFRESLGTKQEEASPDIRTESTHRADATATLLIGILIGAVICAVLFAIVKLLG